MRPEPLGCGSIAVLARELHGLEPDDAFCAAVEKATGGNPLFVGAVLDSVALDALTASERRVAQLAADGMTNKEIAQTLFVTIKTVEVHLSHVYRKLEISTRAQLDRALLTPEPTLAPASA